MRAKFLINGWSLRVRIFLSMILITLISSILVASISIIQFGIESKEYHQERLERKENQIKEHINYILATTPHPLITDNIPYIFKNKIYEISNIHNLEINIYDLNGVLLIDSYSPKIKGRIALNVPREILDKLENTPNNRYVSLAIKKKDRYRFSYSYLIDYIEKKPIGIIKLPYKEDQTFYKNELRNFMSIFLMVYIVVLIFSVFIAYYLSRFITKSLETIANRLSATSLTETNKKIELKSNSFEIDCLVDSYNHMIDELEESANQLAQSQREAAWKEMAKQVAHEVKNPLTPMRLTVQSFQRKFDPTDPNIHKKVADFSNTILQQIDTMTDMATAFSDFASMPIPQNETLDVVKVIKVALDVFNEDCVCFESDSDEIITKIDRNQLIRVVTNLVKNAVQSIPDEQLHKETIVKVKEHENNIIITVQDNGKGIDTKYYENIFEPKFTTKTNGMGLGLGIIKKIVENYKGTISFTSQINKGTTFKVKLPITN